MSQVENIFSQDTFKCLLEDQGKDLYFISLVFFFFFFFYSAIDDLYIMFLYFLSAHLKQQFPWQKFNGLSGWTHM